MMTQEMMKQCCGESGVPNFEMMKKFMENCGKQDFSSDDIDRMQQFCCAKAPPDAGQMTQLMENCGCDCG